MIAINPHSTTLDYFTTIFALIYFGQRSLKMRLITFISYQSIYEIIMTTD